MRNMSYNALSLSRDSLGELIKEYCEKNFTENSFKEIKHVYSNQYRAEFIADKEKITLDFYYKGDGSTSISLSGENQEKAKLIAEYIKKSNNNNADSKNVKISLKNINNDIVDLTNEFIKELVDVELKDEFIDSCSSQWKYRSKYGDELSLSYYPTTHSFLLQGKPLYLYNHVISLLSEFLNLNDTIKLNEALYSVKVNQEKIKEDLDFFLDKSRLIFNEDILRLFSTAVMHMQIKVINCPDYS